MFKDFKRTLINPTTGEWKSKGYVIFFAAVHVALVAFGIMYVLVS